MDIETLFPVDLLCDIDGGEEYDEELDEYLACESEIPVLKKPTFAISADYQDLSYLEQVEGMYPLFKWQRNENERILTFWCNFPKNAVIQVPDKPVITKITPINAAVGYMWNVPLCCGMWAFQTAISLPKWKLASLIFTGHRLVNRTLIYRTDTGTNCYFIPPRNRKIQWIDTPPVVEIVR